MEPIFHYFLPVLLLLFFFPRLRNKLGIRNILLLGFLSFLPDFDIYFFGSHRFLFHNIFFVLIVFLVLYFVFSKLIGLLSLYFLGSHLLFDLSKPGIALFYPFINKLVFFQVMISNTYKWFLHIDFGFLDPSAVDPLYPHIYLWPHGALFLIFVFVVFVVKGFINLKKGKSFWKVFN